MRVRCGWCDSNNVGDRPNCSNCGGVLPVPPGADPGPVPPPPPRGLPTRYTLRKLFTQNFLFVFGVMFGGIGLAFALLFVALMIVLPPIGFGACVGALFACIGFPLAISGYLKRAAMIRALRMGRAAQGKIVAVGRDQSESRNGRHPWMIEYTFDAGGEIMSGSASSWDASMSERQPGQAIHVVYLPSDPEQNAVWPPIK